MRFLVGVLIIGLSIGARANDVKKMQEILVNQKSGWLEECVKTDEDGISKSKQTFFRFRDAAHFYYAEGFYADDECSETDYLYRVSYEGGMKIQKDKISFTYDFVTAHLFDKLAAKHFKVTKKVGIENWEVGNSTNVTGLGPYPKASSHAEKKIVYKDNKLYFEDKGQLRSLASEGAGVKSREYKKAPPTCGL